MPQEEMRLRAGGLRGASAGALCDVYGVRAQGEALQFQTPDVLSQKGGSPSAGCILRPGPSLLFLCRTRQLSHGFPPNFGSALSVAF